MALAMDDARWVPLTRLRVLLQGEMALLILLATPTPTGGIPAPLGSRSWAGMPPVGVGVARSIRSAISPWRSTRSLVRGTHLASSIARAMRCSTDDRDQSSVALS